jgi:hypothetical protein
MTKYLNLRISVKYILAFLAAVVFCTIFFSFKASAVIWSELSGDDQYNKTITANTTLTLDSSIPTGNDSTIYINNRATLTIDGGSLTSGGQIFISILSDNASVIINGTINMTGTESSIYIMNFYSRQGLSVDISNCTITSDATIEPIYVPSGIASVTISNSSITCTGNAEAISLNSPATLNNVTVNTSNAMGIYTLADFSMTGGSITSSNDRAIHAGAFEGTSFSLSGVTVSSTGSSYPAIDFSGKNNAKTADISISNSTITQNGGSGNALSVNYAKSLSITNSGSTTSITCTNGNTGSALVAENVLNGTTITGGVTISNVSTANNPAIKTNSNFSMTDGRVESPYLGIDASDFIGTSFRLLGTNTVTVSSASATQPAVLFAGKNSSQTADIVIDNAAINKNYGSGDALVVNYAQSLSINGMMMSCTNGNTGSALNVANVKNGTSITSCQVSNISQAAAGSAPAILCAGNLTIGGDSMSVISGQNAIEHSNGNLIINKGTITGSDGATSALGSGLYLKAGSNCTINDGSITASTTTDAAIKADSGAGGTAASISITGSGVSIAGASVHGIKLLNNASLSMSNGAVSGSCGIFTDTSNSSASTIVLSGGTVTGTGQAALYMTGESAVTISGADLVNNTNNGVLINNANARLSMTSGTITGTDDGLELNNFSSSTPISVSGGSITGTGDNGIEHNTSGGTLTISGSTTQISGANAGLDLYTGAIANVRGGTLSGTGGSGYAIKNNGGTLNILSEAPVLLRGNDQALDSQPDFVVEAEYTASEYYAGTESVVYTTPFVFDALHKYIRFSAVAIAPVPPAPPAPTTSTPTPEPSSNNNSGSVGEPYYNPPTPNSVAYDSLEYILVIATLNKSGSVNSKETAKDMWNAEERAKQFDIPKIYLKIPKGGIGISASTMKKQYEIANKTELYLLFDLYETVIDKKGKEESIVVGEVFIPINEKSGQILTGVSFKSKNIDAVESYIEKKWKTNILGSFETAQKNGWYSTARITVDIEKLGFSADNGTKLYALIYDMKTKKFYQTDVIITDGKAVLTTQRSGIVVIVNKSIK